MVNCKKNGICINCNNWFCNVHAQYLCDLKKLLECAKIAREWDFVELLEGFIKKGYKYAHLDGNRCDSFIDFYKGRITLNPADYLFQDGFCDVIKEDEIKHFTNDIEVDKKGNETVKKTA